MILFNRNRTSFVDIRRLIHQLRPGSTLDPAAAAYRAFPDVLARLEETGGKGRKGREGEERETRNGLAATTQHNTTPRHRPTTIRVR